MKKKKNKRVIEFHLLLTKDEEKKLIIGSEKSGMSKSEIIRRAICNWMHDNPQYYVSPHSIYRDKWCSDHTYLPEGCLCDD